MNVAKALETGFGTLLRDKASLGADVLIRCFQTLEFDPKWKKEKDRHLPCLVITASPPRVGEDQHSIFSRVEILPAVSMNADANHAFFSNMFTETKKVLDALFAQFMSQSGGATEELTLLNAHLQSELGATFNGVAGIEWGDCDGPIIEPEDKTIAALFVINVHYTRSDY